METLDFLSVIRKRIGTLFLVGLAFAALSFAFLSFSQKAFKVRTDFFVTQNNAASQDFYAMARSNEYVGKILSEAIYSERFISAATETGKISASSLPAEKKKKLDEWSEMVSVKKNLELGMISVTVFHDNQKEATAFSEAIADVLMQKNSLFRGGEEKSVEVRILTGPLVETNPSAAQFALVTVGGFAFGVLLSMVLLFVRTETFFEEEKRMTRRTTPVYNFSSNI